MTTTTHHRPPHEQVFRNFDESVTRVIGADMRLIYGMTVPILMVVGLIIVLALNPAAWLVAVIVLVELAALAVVLTGFVSVLNEPEDDERS